MALITPEAVISYPSLFTPRLGKTPKPTDKPKYSATLLFLPEALESAEWRAMAQAFLDAAKEKFGDKAPALIKEGAIRLPWRKDVVSKGYPERFAAFINVNASAENPPAVVDRQRKPIADKREIYPGAIVRASLTIYAYGGKGTDFTAGVAFGLSAIQKLRDGDRLDGRSSNGEEFDALPELPAAPLGDDAAAMAAMLA